MCERAGLVKLGHVALDGTKLEANASKHKTMSYDRMEKRAAALEAEVARWLAAAGAAADDRKHGPDKTGDAMTDAIETNMGARPEQLSADAGDCSDANLRALEARGIDAYVATGRARGAVAGKAKAAVATAVAASCDPAPSPELIGPPARVEAMRGKIKAGGHDSPYRLRKQVVEPVIGQIKQARGFRQFSARAASTTWLRSGAWCAQPTTS